MGQTEVRAIVSALYTIRKLSQKNEHTENYNTIVCALYMFASKW